MTTHRFVVFESVPDYLRLGWLALPTLVAKHGGYDKITAEVWTKYDRALANWKERVRWRGVDDLYGEAAE